MLPAILIVDDEKHTREGLRQLLETDYDVYLASNADEAANLLATQEFDAVLTDLRMPGKSGLKVVDLALAQPRRPAVLMMTAYGTVETAVEVMKRGAFDFLTKPLNLERLEVLLRRAVKARRAERAEAEGPVESPPPAPSPRERTERPGTVLAARLLGESETLRAALERVKLVAPARTTVLIEGETGTGKELVAQAIHALSPRASGPFVPVHCAALPSALLESELFGHEKGSFTGAVERRIGRFEAASGGTLFLDEIGEIGPATQVKLLRFLETRVVERIGGIKPIAVDVRLVAATNRNLAEMVKQGMFREDLYFRLNVVSVKLPPLRERKGDIPLLIAHFCSEFARENGVRETRFTPEALALLQAYPWPGNIRELRNFCENAVVLHPGATLNEYDLDPKFRAVVSAGNASAAGAAPFDPSAGHLSVEENEKRLLREALRQARGNRTQAARLLGISRRTLHRRLEKFPQLDIAPEDRASTNVPPT